jgi:hypothetical protein
MHAILDSSISEKQSHCRLTVLGSSSVPQSRCYDGSTAAAVVCSQQYCFGGGPFRRKTATYTQISMSRARFQPTTPLFEQRKTVHVLDRAATVIGRIFGCYFKIGQSNSFHIRHWQIALSLGVTQSNKRLLCT